MNCTTEDRSDPSRSVRQRSTRLTLALERSEPRDYPELRSPHRSSERERSDRRGAGTPGTQPTHEGPLSLGA